MKGKTKRKFTAHFKLKVVLEVLKEKDTLAVISKRHELHPSQISDWKKQFMDAAPTFFDATHKAATASVEPDVALLYEQIGRLQMELTFFKKKVAPMSLAQRRALIDPTAAGSLRQQCQWVGLHRSAYYYQPVAADAEDLLLMRLLDEQYLLTPFYGYRKMQLVLAQTGHQANHKRVRRLMQLVGVETIYAKPNTSKPAIGHRIYPYLLRGLAIVRVHQVWATDITYIPMRTGYMYLIAIIDVYSRYDLRWSVSNTMTADWCSQVLKETLATYPAPAIFNSDQAASLPPMPLPPSC